MWKEKNKLRPLRTTAAVSLAVELLEARNLLAAGPLGGYELIRPPHAPDGHRAAEVQLQPRENQGGLGDAAHDGLRNGSRHGGHTRENDRGHTRDIRGLGPERPRGALPPQPELRISTISPPAIVVADVPPPLAQSGSLAPVRFVPLDIGQPAVSVGSISRSGPPPASHLSSLEDLGEGEPIAPNADFSPSLSTTPLVPAASSVQSVGTSYQPAEAVDRSWILFEAHATSDNDHITAHAAETAFGTLRRGYLDWVASDSPLHVSVQDDTEFAVRRWAPLRHDFVDISVAIDEIVDEVSGKSRKHDDTSEDGEGEEADIDNSRRRAEDDLYELMLLAFIEVEDILSGDEDPAPKARRVEMRAGMIALEHAAKVATATGTTATSAGESTDSGQSKSLKISGEIVRYQALEIAPPAAE